jgi:methylamine---corrinoid protein Co-methyltransferase
MQNMTRLLQTIDRSYSGPLVDEKEFELNHVADGVAAVIKKYDIHFNQDHIIQRDDDMMDRVFQAALDFLISCGVYNQSTRRVIQFTRKEIEEVLKYAPSEVLHGQGLDQRRYYARKVEDPTPPTVSGGPIGTPLSEDMFVPIMQSYWQEPILDNIVPGCLVTSYGREIRSKSPLEIVVCWQEAALGKEAARRAGRPGLSRSATQNAISDIGHLSSTGGGFSPTDTHVTAMVGEMKTNNELLNQIAHSVQQNAVIQGFYNPIFGGLAGGPEGVAILIAAGKIAMSVLYMPASVESCPTHPFNNNSTDPQILRAVSASTTALARNTHLLIEVMTSPVGGPCTETLLYECVGMPLVASACGISRVFGVRSAVGVVENHCTGLETRFNGEVAVAGAGMSREQADEIVQKAVAKYAPMLNQKPIGVPFSEAYDLLTLQPNQRWSDMYEKIKDEVREWGLPL